MLLLLSAIACSRAPVEDRWSHNSVVQIKDSFTSVFVLEQEELSLIDSGYNTDAEPIAAYLAETGRSLADVKHIFFTHGHGDHCGGLDKFPNAQLYAHADEFALLKEETGRDDFTAITEEAYPVGDLTIQTYRVEGHSPGNVVFLVDKVLIMGDSAQAYKDGTLGPTGSYFSDDPELAANSLAGLDERLADQEIEWIAFSHSGALKGTDALVSYTVE